MLLRHGKFWTYSVRVRIEILATRQGVGWLNDHQFQVAAGDWRVGKTCGEDACHHARKTCIRSYYAVNERRRNSLREGANAVHEDPAKDIQPTNAKSAQIGSYAVYCVPKPWERRGRRDDTTEEQCQRKQNICDVACSLCRGYRGDDLHSKIIKFCVTTMPIELTKCVKVDVKSMN